MIKQHLEYKISDDYNTPLWRYLDTRKLTSLLKEKSLYFRRSDRFEDEHEGSYSNPTIINRPKFFEGATKDFLIKGLPEMHKTWRKCTYVNSWHASDYESLAMWKLYKSPVAIKSSILNLKEGITSNQEFCLGFIDYIDYNQDQMLEVNAFSPFFHKQKAYEYEKEFRILTFLNTDVAKVHKKEFVPEDGILITVEINKLINSIVISPQASKPERQEIEELLKKFNLLSKLKASVLNREPVF